MIIAILSDGLLHALRATLPDASDKVRQLAQWLLEATIPPDGLRVLGSHGELVTGVLVVENGRPVLAFVMTAPGRHRDLGPPYADWDREIDLY